jgi:hypothetical protein
MVFLCHRREARASHSAHGMLQDVLGPQSQVHGLGHAALRATFFLRHRVLAPFHGGTNNGWLPPLASMGGWRL